MNNNNNSKISTFYIGDNKRKQDTDETIFIGADSYTFPYYRFYSDENLQTEIDLILDISKSYTFKMKQYNYSHPFYIGEKDVKSEKTDSIKTYPEHINITGSQLSATNSLLTISFEDSFDPNRHIIKYYCTTHPQMIETIQVNDSNKQKFLCLHGGGGTGEGIQASLLNNLIAEYGENYQFISPTAIEDKLWLRDPPNKLEGTSDPNWASSSIEQLNNLITKFGGTEKFDYILGYSQGVPMIITYLAKLKSEGKPNTFNKVILLNGYLPETHKGLITLIDSQKQIDIETFIFLGEKDQFYKLGQNIKEGNYFNNPTEITGKNADHDINGIFDDQESYAELKNFIEKTESTAITIDDFTKLVVPIYEGNKWYDLYGSNDNINFNQLKTFSNDSGREWGFGRNDVPEEEAAQVAISNISKYLGYFGIDSNNINSYAEGLRFPYWYYYDTNSEIATSISYVQIENGSVKDVKDSNDLVGKYAHIIENPNYTGEACCINNDWIDPNAVCTEQYDPIVGCNGVTYGNECKARAAGVTRGTKNGVDVCFSCPEGETSAITSLKINLKIGWNLIAGLAEDSEIKANNIITTDLMYSFDETYIKSTYLQAGKGYWIHASKAGEIEILKKQ